jgi:large subunit ribosomal protein L15
VITDTVDMTFYVSTFKILGRGELKAKLKVTAHKFTATAKPLSKLLEEKR